MKAFHQPTCPPRPATRRSLLAGALAAGGLLLSLAASGTTLDHGMSQYEAGAWSAAEQAFRQAIAADSDDHRARYWLGHSLMAQGRWEEAVEVLEQAVAQAPANARYHRLLGEALGRHAEVASVLKRLGLAKRGLHHFEKAVELDPHDLEARDSLMEYYLQAPGFAGGGEAKAVAQAEAVLAFDAAAGYRLLGRIHHHEERTDRARAAYENALEHEPANRLARLGLARLAIDLDQWRLAFETLEAMLRDTPDDPLALFELGRAAARSGMKLAAGARALDSYTAQPRPAHQAPPMIDALELLAEVQVARGQVGAARRAYDRILAVEPKHSDARRARARLADG